MEEVFLVVYDFRGHIPTRFYDKISDLGVRIQKSVYLVEGRARAEALVEIARHYGGDARVFRVVEEVV